MSIIINAKGTSVPYFTIGKNGTTLYQGSTDPGLTYTLKNGDVWFNTSTNALESWVTASDAWAAPRLADLNFSGSTIIAEDSVDLILKTTSGNNIVLDAGAGNPVLTALTGKNLYISESIGGDLYLNVNKWPAADGAATQSLTTDGSGVLSWTSTVHTITGTANQIVSSSSTGNITLSTATTFIAPGSLQYVTNTGYSSETIGATGTTQATASLISKTHSIVATASAPTAGVRLPVPSFVGEIHVVDNHSGVQIYVYPQVGSGIDEGTVNDFAYIVADQLQQFLWDGNTWNTYLDNIAEGNAGVSLTSSKGNITISNTGVLSFSAGTTGLTPATATTGVVTLGGTLSIGNGGTNATSTITAFNNLSPLTTAGDTLYSNGTNNVRLPVGANTTILSITDGAPSWVSQSSLSVGSSTTATTATNITGGAAGSVIYQSASGTTTTLAIGSTNEVLSVQGGIPDWTSVSTVLGYTPVNKAGDTMTGYLILNADPVAALGAATKQYVDTISQGLKAQPACITATTSGSNLSAATYYNGPTETPGLGATLTATSNVVLGTIGGASSLSTSDRILVKDQSDSKQNGIYVVTSLGSVGVSPWVLTRATDFDGNPTGATKSGDFTFIQSGTLTGSQWVLVTVSDPIIMGTDNILFTQLSGASSMTAGTGISISENTISNTGVLSITTSSGLSTNTSATGAVSITNTGVTSAVAGNGITVSSTTGAVTISAAAPITQNITSAYTVLSTDYSVFANAASGGFTVTLPATPTAGEIHNIKKVDQTRTTVTINGNGHNIDKYGTVVINVPFVSIAVQWNSATSLWQII